MPTLHIANKNYSSWSLRAWVLMRQLGIPFEERLHPFPERGKDEAFRGFSPTGKVPCLHDLDLAVWDTLAIAEYLAERHAGVWPAAAGARAWARSAAAEMHSGFFELRERCPMNCGLTIALAEFPPALAREVERLGALWSEGLERFGGPFLAGDAFCAVDAFFAPVAHRVRTYDLPLPAAARDYADGLLGLPAMLEWEAAALAEEWREPGHEAEARAAGEWIEDRRAT